MTSELIASINNFTTNLASSLRPNTFREVLGWGCWLWLNCPAYRQAIKRGASYFMTEVDVEARDDTEGKEAELKQMRALLNRRFSSTGEMLTSLEEALGFGCALQYLHFPLDKRIICDCGATAGLEQGMREQGVTYDSETHEYKGECSVCHKKVTYKLHVIQDPEQAEKAKLVRIPLSICRHVYNSVTKDRRVFADVARWENISKGVTDGDPMIHATLHPQFVEAVSKNAEILFTDKHVHYMRFHEASMIEETLDGWSLPPFFYAFSDVIAIVLLQKYNQTILKDYVLPLRYVAPPPVVGAARYSGEQANSFEPTRSPSSSSYQFRTTIVAFLRDLKANADKIGVAPFPVQFGYLGLEGKQLLTVDVMQYYVDQLMQNMGIPPEFYRGGIQATVATPSHYGFKLFERFWSGLASVTTESYQWVADRIAEVQKWPSVEATLIPPTQYADPALLPFLQVRNDQGKLSDDSYDRILSIRTEYERKTVKAERAKMMDEFSEEDAVNARKQMVGAIVSEASPDMQAYQQIAMAQQMQAQGGAAGAAGAPMAPGPPGTAVPAAGPGAMDPSVVAGAGAGQPGSMIDPAEMQVMQRVYSRAQETANQLINLDMPTRVAMLRDIEAQNPQLSALIKQALGELERQAERTGLMAAREGSMPVQPPA